MPYGKREYAEKVLHDRDEIVRRKRGINPNEKEKP